MNPFLALGPRERELLALAARPMSAKEIAIETGLSLGTVNNYLSSAQRRLGARNRNEAVRMFRAHVGDASFVHSKAAGAAHLASTDVHREPQAAPRAALHMQGVSDSIAPRSRDSLEVFLGPATWRSSWELPLPESFDWRSRLYAVLAMSIGLTFLLAAVVILLDALTRLTTTSLS